MIRRIFPIVALVALALAQCYSQIPLERVLSRVAVPSAADLRGLVDTKGFPTRPEQMDAVGKLSEKSEASAIAENQKKFGFTDETAFVAGICPHDDYMIAGPVYLHVQRYIKAKTVILIGNAHWSEAFGIRNKLIFGDFKRWRGPYGTVTVSAMQDGIMSRLQKDSYTVNRRLVETEHSLEGLVPYLQYLTRSAEILPILVPYSEWDTIDRLGAELAGAVAALCREKNWTLGRDVAVLCSSDGQHYGDYGWPYYNYHPFGCDAEGYKSALALDRKMINDHLVGTPRSERIHALFSTLVDQGDISRYRVTWCGRFAVPFGINFATHLVTRMENRDLTGYLLRTGASLADPWLPVGNLGLGATSDANLHHFVTYFALGFK
jgi:MEMO1 family protein